MKIFPIIAYGHTNLNQNRNVNFKHDISTDSEKNGIQEINLNNQVYYLMPSRDDRTYTSANKDLVDIPSNFKITAFDDVPCPSCGKKMLPKEKYEEFLSRLDETPNEGYIGLLKEYQDYMRPVESSVLDEISAMSESAGTKDIRTLLVKLRDTKLPTLQKVQLKKVKEMEKLSKRLPQNEQKLLNGKLTNLRKIIKQEKSSSPFRRKRMIDEISQVKLSNPYKYTQLQHIARSFPTSSDMNSAWIVKYSGLNKFGENWKSKDIARRLLEFSVPNTDHILARDIELNHDDINNYMAMHKSCNEQKANKGFLEWYFEDKITHLSALTDYFQKADELISSKKIDDSRYTEYVANATQLIFELSHGKVDLRKKEN